MNKRLLRGTILLGLVSLFGLIYIVSLAYDLNLRNDQSISNPGYLDSYPETGYFKINPETILRSLSQGNADVFMPSLEDPNSVEPLTHGSFSWAQGDFLQVASALGQLIWKDPMSLEDWSVDNVIFRTDCRDHLNGFDFAGITYFRPIAVNGKKFYTTRHIEIDLYYGIVRWGSGAIYSRPILLKWKSFNFAEANFTADDALQIAEKNGGKERRLEVENKCAVYIGSPQNNNHNNWYLSYLMPPDFVNYLIDLDTGEYKISSVSQ